MTTPTQLAIRAGLEVAEKLAQAHASLRRIDEILRLMRESYAAAQDLRAAALIDVIRDMVVGPELDGGATSGPIGIRHAAARVARPQADGGD